MIIVDSSVWIDVLRDRPMPQTATFFAIKDLTTVILGDIVLLEILQGTESDRHAHDVRRQLEKFHVVPMLSPALAIKAATNYRRLRTHGRTVSKTADLIIGTYCIEHGHSLLQRDKDYLPMANISACNWPDQPLRPRPWSWALPRTATARFRPATRR